MNSQKVLIVFVLYFFILNMVNAQQQTDTLTIFFDIDKAVVDENKAKQLDMIVNDTNIVSISITGYTDFLGSVEYNSKLSEKRSANVRHYFIEKGVDNNMITHSKGNGVHPNSIEKNRHDFSDKGIKDHRIVQVIYCKKPKTSLSEENLVTGNVITIESIFFDYLTFTFVPKSYPALNELFEVMKKFPSMKIEIQGHICCYHGEYYITPEKPLSLGRAKAVRDYLAEKGIDPNRMTCKGFGSSQRKYPLEQNEYEKDMNRRVDILILEM